MAKKQRGDGLTAQVGVRFPADLLERLERYTERLKRERPGLSVSRADVVRMLVHERLDAIDTEDSTKK